MARKKKRISQADNERINQYLQLFANESPEIRDEIATSLPAYNTLLSLHASSFEEFALLPIARELQLSYESPLFDFKEVRPICPKCGEKQNIRISATNSYICNKCGKKYAANHRSISSNTNCSSLTWMKVLHCMLQFYTIDKTCTYCGISPTTFYNIRNRLFHAMEIMLNNIKLYGKIQCDNTFVKISYKGLSLTHHDYPEDSPFYQIAFILRLARSRGGHYKHSELNNNVLCIFTALDEFGHSVVKFTSIGITNSRSLYNAVGPEKYLKTVPDIDYDFYMSKGVHSILSQPGDCSVLISDGETAIKKYAEMLGLEFESHVYRKNGVQMKLPSSANNIQKVNLLHKKLKDFLRKTNYVSSKYLPGYLVFFEFIENTGASTEAIGQLFEILAKPGLQKPPSYYKDKYSIPNYLAQKKDSDNPLRNIPENQLLVCYLCDKRIKEKENGFSAMTFKQISEETGYSPSSIRRIYKNFTHSQFNNLIEEYFESESYRNKKSKKLQITPEMLAIFDEYAANRMLPRNKRLSQENFLAEIEKKYHLSYKRSTFLWTLEQIVEAGLRPPLPELKKWDKKDKGAKNMVYLEMYESLINEYRKRNEKPPKVYELLEMLSEKTGFSTVTLKQYLREARKYRLEQFGESAKNRKL